MAQTKQVKSSGAVLAVQRMALAQAISSWVSCCDSIKQAQNGKQTGYLKAEKQAEILSAAEYNFPEYCYEGTFYRGLSLSESWDDLRGLSSDKKTFLNDSCCCSSKSEQKALSFGPWIIIFKNCLAIDAKLTLESNGLEYNHKSEKEMIVPAYLEWNVVSIVGNYLTVELKG